jgi:hypothetical protein
MTRSTLGVALICMLAAACTRSSPPAQSAAPGDKAPPPAAAPPSTPAQQPASAPSSAPAQASTPASAPAASPQAARPAATPEPAHASTAAETPSPASSAPAAPAPAPEPPKPAEPEVVEVTIPADRTLSITLTTRVASDSSKVEDQVRGTLAKAIVVSGKTVVPAGSELVGSVLEANESGRVKGRASVAFRFNQLFVRGESHPIHTSQIARQAASSTKDDVKKGGIGAGVGAVVGGIAGGGKGAVIGGAIGGAGTVMATKGKEVRLEPGTTVSTTLTQPLKVLVATSPK